MISSLSPEEANRFVSEVVDNSSNDFKIDLSFFFRTVKDMREKGNNTKGNIERDTVFIPFILVSKFLD